MGTDSTYDLSSMLPGVLDNALNGGRCRSCHRATNDMVIGHDGYCPVPALTKAISELAAATARAERAERVIVAANALRDATLACASHSMGCAGCMDGVECEIGGRLWTAETKAEFDLFAALAGPEGGERNGEDHA